MKKILIFLVTLLVVVGNANAASLRQMQLEIVDEFWQPVTDITQISIFDAGTSSATTISSDRAGSLTMTNPITTGSTNSTFDQATGFVRWYQRAATYKVTITNGTKTLTIDNMNATLIRFPWFINYIGTAASLSVKDNQEIIVGTDSDYSLAWDNLSSFLRWTPLVDDSRMDIGSTAATSDLNLYGGTSGRDLKWDASENTLELLDNTILAIGTSDDFTISHDGSSTTTFAGTYTATGVVTQQGDMLFDGTSADIRWDASEDTLGVLDDAVLGFGNTAAAPDVEISFDQTDLDVTSSADGRIWKWGNATNDFDMWWYGGDAADYMIWDEGDVELRFHDAHLQLNDDATLIVGTDDDWTVFSDTDGILEIVPDAQGNEIRFGAGSLTSVVMTWYSDTDGDTVVFNEELVQVEFEDVELQMFDDTSLQFGDSAGGDVSVEYDTDLHNALLWAGAGHIGNLKILELEAGTSETVLATESGKVFYSTTEAGAGSTTYTLPTAAAGLWYTFIDTSPTAGDDLWITANTGDGINSGTIAKSFKHTDDFSPAAVTLVAVDAGSWEVMMIAGTWTNDDN